MKKLVNGIVEFRKKLQPNYRATFAHLALGQSPDALFISCSDSRVAVNVFASTEPGDLFVIRNVGNLVPPSAGDGHSSADESEAAALEFALGTLNVSNIIVCGHSECGAMIALTAGRDKVPEKNFHNLRAWLRHGEQSLVDLQNNEKMGVGLAKHNRLSQFNVLRQLENLKTYPIVQERLEAGTLRLHGWWFDISNADVYAYEETKGCFVLFDEEEAARIYARLDGTGIPHK